MKRSLEFWLIQCPGWLLLAYLGYAQVIPAFDYETGVRLGTQEPAEVVSEVGVAFWYGFALADLVVYVPLLACGLLGHLLDRRWGRIALAASMGITIYWPVVCLAVVVAARDAAGWHLEDELPYWIALPLIACWATWALWRQVRN